MIIVILLWVVFSFVDRVVFLLKLCDRFKSWLDNLLVSFLVIILVVVF